jgi:hypothetical protein
VREFKSANYPYTKGLIMPETIHPYTRRFRVNSSIYKKVWLARELRGVIPTQEGMARG